MDGKITQSDASIWRQVEKSVLLDRLDHHWKEHLAVMDHLRQSGNLRGYAQKNPVQEYKRESFSMFTLLLETINVETDRLKKLVNDILDFSRLEEGNFDLEKEEADITPVINLTVQSVKVLAQQKNIAITTAIESNLPRVWINSDSIERVLRNLLSNAIKYTPNDGKIKLRAEVSEVGDSLEISVQDNGI